MELKPGYKLTEVGEIPEDWEVKPLKKISPQQSVGLVINPSTYFDKAGTIPMLVGSNIGENQIDWAAAQRITEASNQMLPSSRLSEGDLVMVRVGEPGTTAVIPTEFDGCNCASMMIVRKHPSFDSHWLCFAMNSPLGRSRVTNVQYGTAQKQFNISDAIDFLYPTPPLPEQRAIAEALSDVDALLDGLDRLIAKHRDLKQATMQQLLTGQTRLPGFTGEWEVKRLGEMASINAGGTPSRTNPNFWNGDIPWITTSEVDFYTINHAEQFISNEGLNNSAAKLLPSGTLLMALYGQGKTRGKVGILGIEATTNQACAAILLKPSVSHQFVFYFLSSQYDTIRKLSNNGNQENLNGSLVRSISILLPPTIAEQTAIAAVLSDMDAELAALEARRAKTRLLKQAMMQELLTGKTRLT